MAVILEWVDGRRYRRLHLGDRVVLIPDRRDLDDVIMNGVDDSFHVKAGVVEELLEQIQEEVLI